MYIIALRLYSVEFVEVLLKPQLFFTRLQKHHVCTDVKMCIITLLYALFIKYNCWTPGCYHVDEAALTGRMMQGCQHVPACHTQNTNTFVCYLPTQCLE